MKARATVKRVAKLVLPYGVVLLAKSARRKSATVNEKLVEQRRLNKMFSDLLSRAKTVDTTTNPDIIISLTSYGKRIESTAPLAIASILCGSERPNRLMLWLAHGEKPSAKLNKLTKFGLEIGFTENTYSYKKLLPTLRQYPESTIIIVDDDVTYPEDWLEKTLRVHAKYPDAVLANRARELTTKNGDIINYWDWPVLTKNPKNHHLIFPTGVGGVLYPPHSLSKEVFNQELFMKISPRGGDDAWFWAMSELKGTKRILIEDGFRDVESFELDRITALSTTALVSNKERLTRIFEHFPEIEKNIIIAS